MKYQFCSMNLKDVNTVLCKNIFFLAILYWCSNQKKNVYLILLTVAFLRTLGQQSTVNKETVDCH